MNEIRNGIAETGSNTVGSQLRAAREAQDLSVAEVAERTRIPTRHLVAIENDDHRNLPAATYSSGFVKTYARLLGLDGQGLAVQFRGELIETAPRTAYHAVYEPADPARTPTRGIAWAALAVALFAVMGFLYWRGLQSEDPVRVAAAAGDVTVAAPANPTAASAAPSPPSSGPTVLTAESPVWLRVSQPEGPKLYEGILQTGQSYTVPPDAADPRLLTGRPNALKVVVGATVIPPLGPPERRVRDVSLRPAALIAFANGAAEPGAPEPASANPVPLPADAPTPVESQATPN